MSFAGWQHVVIRSGAVMRIIPPFLASWRCSGASLCVLPTLLSASRLDLLAQFCRTASAAHLEYIDPCAPIVLPLAHHGPHYAPIVFFFGFSTFDLPDELIPHPLLPSPLHLSASTCALLHILAPLCASIVNTPFFAYPPRNSAHRLICFIVGLAHAARSTPRLLLELPHRCSLHCTPLAGLGKASELLSSGRASIDSRGGQTLLTKRLGNQLHSRCQPAQSNHYSRRPPLRFRYRSVPEINLLHCAHRATGIAVFSLLGFASHYPPLCIAQAIGLQVRSRSTAGLAIA